MAKAEKNLPFATFALLQTNQDGFLLHQNRRAQKKLWFRRSTNVISASMQSKERIESEIAQNGYAVASFSFAHREACALVYSDKMNLWWLFLEELQQDLLRDTLLSRPERLCRLKDILCQDRDETPEGVGTIADLLLAGVSAQSDGVELVDAKSFLHGLYVPILQHAGIGVEVRWEQEEKLLPISFAEYAMSLLHIAQIFASYCRAMSFSFCADEFALFARVTPKRKMTRKTAASLARKLALDCAVTDCLQSDSLRIEWSCEEDFCCRISWSYDCHAVSYLGNHAVYQSICESQFKAELSDYFS